MDMADNMVDSGKTKYSGGCACGEIRFGFYDPLLFKLACHCRDCQYTAAGGPAFVVGVLCTVIIIESI